MNNITKILLAFIVAFSVLMPAAHAWHCYFPQMLDFIMPPECQHGIRIDATIEKIIRVNTTDEGIIYPEKGGANATPNNTLNNTPNAPPNNVTYNNVSDNISRNDTPNENVPIMFGEGVVERGGNYTPPAPAEQSSVTTSRPLTEKELAELPPPPPPVPVFETKQNESWENVPIFEAEKRPGVVEGYIGPPIPIFDEENKMVYYNLKWITFQQYEDILAWEALPIEEKKKTPYPVPFEVKIDWANVVYAEKPEDPENKEFLQPFNITEKASAVIDEFVEMKIDRETESYEVTGKKAGKFLGLVDVKMDVTAVVDAKSGNMTVKKPWWSFLVI